jgi:DNA repair protein RadC
MEYRGNTCDLSRISEIELVYHNPVRPSKRPLANSSKKSYKLFIKHWNTGTLELQESMKALLLNRANKVLGIYDVSMGGISTTVCDCRLLLAAALKATASSIILAHNHPSGSLKPSEADDILTQKLKIGAALMDITLLDHLIITARKYYSYADEGRL